MKNNELFKNIFGIYAEEFWAFPEEKMLNWLGCEVSTQNNDSNALKALDCVSRQAAIDALGFYKPVSDTWTDEYEIGVYKQWQKDKKAISDLPSVDPKWIPVTERLPEVGDYYAEGLRESKPVLICGKTQYGVNGYALAVSTYITDDIDHDDGWSQPYDYADCEMEIVAWMPLPKPYEYPPSDFMNKPEEHNE